MPLVFNDFFSKLQVPNLKHAIFPAELIALAKKQWPLATLFNTTNLFPPEICEPPLIKQVLKLYNPLSGICDTDQDYALPLYALPLSVSLMFDALWAIGLIKYDFPLEAAPFVGQGGDGKFIFGFTYCNEEGSADDKDGYADPDYIEDVENYLTSIIEVGSERMEVDIQDYVLKFKDKKAIYTLLCNMIENEEFNLAQPEEAIMTSPIAIEREELSAYLSAKMELSSEWGRKEDPELLLNYAPLKPFSSKERYLAEAAMACESPFMVNMAQLRLLLIKEGEENVPERLSAKPEYYSIGLH